MSKTLVVMLGDEVDGPVTILNAETHDTYAADRTLTWPDPIRVTYFVGNRRYEISIASCVRRPSKLHCPPTCECRVKSE
jgi:hypothetical protein